MAENSLIERGVTLAKQHEEKLRFLVVGVFNTAIGYGLFAAWYFVLERANLGPLHYNLALGLSWVMSVPISYSNFKRWVFQTRGTNWMAELGRSYIVYSAGLLVNYAVLNFFVLVLHLHPLVGQFASIFVVTIMSYLGHKYFTFGKKHLIETVAEPGVLESELEERD